MKKTLLIIVICCALIASWVLLIGNKKELATVTIHEIVRKDLKKVVELSGSVTSGNIYVVSSTTGGKVDSVYVQEGELIKPSDVLIKLNTDLIDIELKKAKLELSQIESMLDSTSTPVSGQSSMPSAIQTMEERAKIALALSQSVGLDMESFNSAFSEEMVEEYADFQAALTSSLTSETLEDYEQSFNKTQSVNQTQKELANLAVSSLEESIESMSLKSEISGEVISVNCLSGAFLAPGMPAMVVADLNEIIIEAVAFEKDISHLEENMDVNIFTNDDSEFYHIGHISKVGSLESSVSEYQSSDVMAKITIIPNSSFSSKIGSSTDIEVVLDGRENILALPVDCITGETNVFVVEDDVIHTREITTGFTDGYYIEIISGLNEGETVVLCPEDLIEGDKVEIE
jgi:multidrug efflux pump subunit AcrA (membrane-fusion protein)